MAKILLIDKIEQLLPYANKDGILEIAIRDTKKKFVSFKKIALNSDLQEEGKELLNKVISHLNNNNTIPKNGLNAVTNIAKLQQLNFLLSGADLCATCIGFAIMYAKLDKMSEQIKQLLGVIKEMQGTQTDYEFKKVIAEHSNMLDSRKTQKYYTEEQMRKLVDDEYNVLNLLINVFMKDLAQDQENLIFSIYSLASMLAVSLRYFDELYYFNNKEAIGDGEVWHSSHDNWMLVFDRLTSDSFVKRIQDHGIFELDLTTVETDAYYLSLNGQVKGLKEDIEDNQTLITTLNNEDLMADFNEYVKEEVISNLQQAFDETEGAADNPEVVKVYQDAIKQVVLAV